jgi:hypothetical protein
MTNRSCFTVLGLILALGAAGCGDEFMDPNTATAGACVGLKTSDQNFDSDQSLAISTHVPVGMNVYCATKGSFLWEGGIVDLVWIAYGSAPGVPAATPITPNTVCALDQGNGVSLLFDAVWTNNEPPLSIGTECPAIALNATGDTAVQCTAPPVTGRTHPVLADRNFRQFFTQPQPLPTQLAVCGRFLPPGEP